MENEMTTQDMWDFLEKGAHVAHIGTTRADGRPHVTPVSFGAWDGKVYAVLVGGSVKVKNLRRDPRVYISVATDERPYQFVLVEGKAKITEDGLAEVLERLLTGYVGPERGRALARESLERLPHLLVMEVEPDKMLSHYEAPFATLRGRSIVTDGRQFGQPWLSAAPDEEDGNG